MKYTRIPTHVIAGTDIGVHLLSDVKDKKGNVPVDDCKGQQFLLQQAELRWIQQPAHGPIAHALHEIAVYGTQFEVEGFDFYLEIGQGVTVDLGFWWTESYDALADVNDKELEAEPELAHRQRMFLLFLCEIMNDVDI